MYPPMKFEDGEELELRPVNCPHHIVIYQTELRSYRDLPLRIAEIGNNWRYERSGTLAGMNRVRSFALNDAHIFCTPEQLMDEVKGAIDLALYFSKVLGIDEFWYQLSTRDDVKDKWLGDEGQWRRRRPLSRKRSSRWVSSTGSARERRLSMVRRSTSRSTTRIAASSRTPPCRSISSCRSVSISSMSPRTGRGNAR